MSPPKPDLSVVVPVRDAQDSVVRRIEELLENLCELIGGSPEIVVVDDGSRDATAELLDELSDRYPQVRSAYHPRILGFDVAGQTGLEKATADVVFICEDDRPIRPRDLEQLWRMSKDDMLVAARAESTPRPMSRKLLDRIRGLSDRRHLSAPAAVHTSPIGPTGLQMLRRPHLNYLASPRGRAAEVDHDQYMSTTMG